MDGVGTTIIGTPRHSPEHRRAQHYTPNCEEPSTDSLCGFHKLPGHQVSRIICDGQDGKILMTREMTTTRTASEIIDWIAISPLAR